MEREFSVEEAAALLPRVERLLRAVQAAFAHGLRALERGSPSASTGNGSAKAAEAARGAAGPGDDVLRLMLQVERLGVMLRDPQTGLVDFPSRRDGKPIHLCWRLGEERIAYWHPRDTGIAGRQPL